MHYPRYVWITYDDGWYRSQSTDDTIEDGSEQCTVQQLSKAAIIIQHYRIASDVNVPTISGIVSLLDM